MIDDDLLNDNPYWKPHPSLTEELRARFPPRVRQPLPPPGQDYDSLTRKYGKPTPAPSNRRIAELPQDQAAATEVAAVQRRGTARDLRQQTGGR